MKCIVFARQVVVFFGDYIIPGIDPDVPDRDYLGRLTCITDAL
jgi:hypothetical protein